jgi:hypothetical protein
MDSFVNPKHEMRAKHRASDQLETSSNDQNPKFKTKNGLLWALGHMNFGFVSNFGIRISNLLNCDEP